MSLGVLPQEGESLGHRHRPAGPAPLLKAVAPARAELGVCVACLLTWDGRADLGARAGIPCVLGPALSRQALQGGKATNDQSDAQTIVGRLRGGLLPQASGYPAEMRAPRALLRRRQQLIRQRTELLPYGQHTHSPDNVPELGNKLAYQATRLGGAERFPAPAVQKSVEVALARFDYEDPLRRALALVKTATQPDAHPLSWLQTVPGSGQILRRGLLYERHDMARCPRGQDFGSSGRLGKCAKASAGKRSGTSGSTIGNASLTWAFSKAAGLCRRTTPAGHKSLARLETKQGKGKALTVLAHKRARAVYDRLQRRGVFALDPFLRRSGRGAGAPGASRRHKGRSLAPVLCQEAPRASTHAPEPRGAWPCPCACAWTPALAPGPMATVPEGDRGLPLPRTCASRAPTEVQPQVCVGRYEGPEMFLGRREP